MAAWALWNPGDQLLAGGMSVLLQITLVTGVTLLLASIVRRIPTIRYGLLCAGLFLILLSPVVTLVMQFTGKSMLKISLQNESTLLDHKSVSTGSFDQTGEAPPLERQIIAEPQTFSPSPDIADQRPQEPKAANSEVALSSPVAPPTAQNASTAVPPDQPARSTWIDDLMHTVMPGLFFIWLSGSILLFLRLIRGWSRLAAILRTAQPNTDPQLAAAFARAAEEFPHIRLPTLLVSERLTGPVSTGLLRSWVVFPEQAVKQLSAEQLREILIHEMAHCVRRDPFILLIQNLAAVFFWLHPFVRILNRQLAQAREEICDNYVLTTTDATSYSRTLLSLASTIQTGPLLPGTIGLFTAQWKLEQRVAGLLDPNRNRQLQLSAKSRLFLAVLALSLTFVIAGGTVAVAQHKPDSSDTVKETSPRGETQSQSFTIHGTITDHDGKPAAGARVEVFRTKAENKAQSERVLLKECKTDSAGHYEVTLPENTVKDNSLIYVIARNERSGMMSNKIKLRDARITLDLQIPVPFNNLIHFVDPTGQPIPNLPVQEMNYTILSFSGPPGPVPLNQRVKGPQNAPAPTSDKIISVCTYKTDDQGVMRLSFFDLRHGVTLKIPGTDQYAPQWIRLNSGLPEERSESDGTYRDTIKNLKRGEDATIIVAPARIFSGRVLLGDSGKPSANTRIKIWSSQQEQLGSLVYIEGKTDAAGRFRLNPYPGVRFGIIAYPPPGTPYLTREVKDLRWNAETPEKPLEIKLDKVVLAEGTVVDAQTGQPLKGASVQYEPEGANHKRNTDEIVTGWQGIQKTDATGKFSIPVLPGPGTLLVHATSPKYILQETDSSTLYRSKPGGMRIYAHAFQKIDPVTDQRLEPMKIELHPGETVTGTLVDEQGKPIKEALMISRLKILPTSPNWRGWPDEVHDGKFQLQGLRADVEYPVYFLDPQRKLGAVATISTRNKAPRIVLKPCGSARVRYLDPKGHPIAGKSLGSLYLIATPGTPRYDFQATSRGEQWADETLVSNLDRVNYQLMDSLTTDAEGKIDFPALIPGATYRFRKIVDGHPIVVDQFMVQPGEAHDIGDVKIELDE